jgi:hypothetical protein
MIASNALPVFGILFLGWSVSGVMVLYWLENIIVGFFTVLKMAFSRGGAGSSSRRQGDVSSGSPVHGISSVMKLMLIPFFCVHFGLFCLVHGAFVAALFLPDFHTSTVWQPLLAGLAVPFIGLLASHGFYFVHTYLRGGLYRYAALPDLMLEPYVRIVPLHFGLILAGLVTVTLGSPVWVVVLLVGLKTGGEVLFYRRSMVRWNARAR